MPSHKDAWLCLKKMLDDAAPTAFRVEWPNVTPDDDSRPFVEFTFVPLGSDDPTMDSSDEMIMGFVHMSIIVDKDTSTEVTGEILDFLRSVYPRGRRETHGTPATKVMVSSHLEPKRLIDDGLFLRTPIDVSYQAT